jgi:hypothetical protein
MWRKLVPPKWRHRNPAIRAEAVNLLKTDDPNLAQVILIYSDAGIRRIAARRLENVDQLFTVVDNDQDESVRSAAKRRIWQLLAGEEGSVPEEETAKILNQQKDPELAEYLVRRSGSKQVRRLALTMLDKPALLADIAMKDADGEIRLEALKAIDRLPTLERIAKQVRGTDKRVARLAREMVENLREQQERPAKQQKAVDQMESFALLLQPDQTAITRVSSEWEQLQQDADEELKQRFAKALTKARQAIETAHQAREAVDRQRQVCDQAKKLLNDLDLNANTPSFDIDGVVNIANLLKGSWNQLEQELGEVNAALATELGETLEKLQQRTRQIQSHRKQYARQLSVLSDIEQVATGLAPVSRNGLKELEKRWRNLPGKPEVDLDRKFKQFLHQAQLHLQQSAEQADELEKQFQKHLQELEKALDNGKLAPANSVMGKARKCHDELQRIAPLKLKATNSTWRRQLGRLAELRDWQQFGSNTVREDLIREMQALVTAEISISERSKRVRDFREKWRQVDRKGGPASEELWQTFNTMAEQAYAPVIAHRDELKERQQQAAVERGTFCDQLEKEYAAIDWENPDWPAIDVKVRQLRDQWHKLGGVDKETWKLLTRRFNEALKPFDEKLKVIRDSEKQRRERIIKQVARLADEPDLQTAIDETLAAQEKWKPLVTASRGIEQRLWKQFRAACDAVFDRRKAQNEEINQELGENADRKQVLLDALLALVELPADQRQQARSERDRLFAEWNEIGQVPKNRFRQINDAWNKALKAFDRAENDAVIERKNSHIVQLADQANRLDALEHSLCAGNAVTVDEELLAGFADRVTAINAGDRSLCDAQADNLDQRNQLLLEIEVLLELETPAAFADQRRQWQLEHLSDAMTGGLTQSPREQALSTLAQVCRTGAVPEDQHEEYLKRQQAIVSALKQ